MKIRVEFLNGHEHRTNQPCQSVSHIFDGDTAVRDHIMVLLAHFKVPVEKVGSYALQNPTTQTYIEDAFLTPERLVEAEKSCFVLRMRPQAIAQRVIDNLKQNSPTSPTTKDIIFNIRYQLKDVDYVEEFIAKGGINLLLDIIAKSHGNTQSYALTALRCFMGFHSGLDEVMSRPHLIDRLYSLVSSTVLASVCRQSIELLFVICNFDGFSKVHRAAKNFSLENNAPAYSNLISLLSSGDMETQLNTLTLFNCLLENAPNPRKVEKLLSRWKALGIVKILKAQEHVTHSDFKSQLARFQAMAGIGFDLGRKRNELSRQLSQQDLEMALVQYQEQQPLVRLLSNELKFLRNAIKSAIENGSYINYRAPTERYDEYLSRKNEIIGEGPVNISYLKRSDKFTNAFRKSITLEDDEFEIEDQKSPYKLTPKDQDVGHLSPISSGAKPPVLSPSSSTSSPSSSNKIVAEEPIKIQVPAITTTTASSSASSSANSSSSSLSNAVAPIPITSFNLFDVSSSTQQLSVSFKSKNALTKPAVTPKKRMKPLYWSRVINCPGSQGAQKKTVWESLPDVAFDEDQFIELFSLYTEKLISTNGSPVLSPFSSSGALGKKPIQKVISLLSQKRSNTISIMCSKLPSDENLIRAIRELDSAKLSLEQVVSLFNNIPTAEEMASIQELSDEFILDKPERWCLMIDGFPKIKPRLRSWEFMLKFDDAIKNIADSIETVSTACNELKTSPSLFYLLSILLSLGNYLNGGNQHRGQADGFQLEAINKMLEIKDNHNSGSLLDFAIKTMLTNHPKNYTLPSELLHIANASLINLEEVGNQLSKLSTDYTDLTLVVDDIVNSTDSEDPFITIIPRFMNNAYTTLRSTQKQYLDTEKLFGEVLDYFNPLASTTTTSTSATTPSSSSLSSSAQVKDANGVVINKFSTEKFFTLFSTIVTAFKKSPSKRMSQKGFGLKIGDSEDPMMTIIESLKKNIDIPKNRIGYPA
eukprot:gene4084-4759_t